MSSLSSSWGGGQWLSAEDIAAQFVVGAQTLALYSARGALPMHADARGIRLYDVDAAATIFQRRGAATADLPRDSFGRLGQVSLGGALPSVPAAAARVARWTNG